MEVVVGAAVDCADDLGLMGVFLLAGCRARSPDDAPEVVRASRTEMGQGERLNTILAQLSDGVIAVDKSERIQNPQPRHGRLAGVDPPPGWGESSRPCAQN